METDSRRYESRFDHEIGIRYRQIMLMNVMCHQRDSQSQRILEIPTCIVMGNE
jgi:hypothetical protein